MLPFSGNTITIYNKYEVKNSVGKISTKWKRTVLQDCSKVYRAIQTKTAVQIAETQLLVQIPFTIGYVSEYEWDNMADRSQVFTVQSGDLVVLMEVQDEVQDGEVIEKIEKKYGSEAFKISQFSNNFGENYPFPHIQVVQ